MVTTNPLSWFTTRVTTQREPIPGSSQVRNSAGGFAWAADDWTRLRRFLILGVDGPSYYATERALVKENAECVLRCVALDGRRVVDEIVAISVAGRNPKHQPVIFALAVCTAAADDAVRAYALSALPKVCRTGTQLFLFAGYVEQFRGWGRGLRRAIGDWYVDRDPDALAYQLIKYQQREGWSHRDLLRLAKPQPARDSATDVALRWAVGKVGDADSPATMPRIIVAQRAAQSAETPTEAARLVISDRLPWESLKSEHLRSPEVWNALIPTMGVGALIRNLARLTTNGTLASGNDAVDVVVRRLGDAAAVRSARVHPIAVLSALLTYRQGRGTRGKQTWEPITAIIDALDRAFYTSFGNVEPAGKRTLLALDVSGSMAGGEIAGVAGLSPRIASAAMAAVTLATEPKVETIGFTSAGKSYWGLESKGPHGWGRGVSRLNLSPRQRLDDIVSSISGLPFGATDCALPMLYALEHGMKIDHFVIYTDSETWSGDVHPSQALRRYRERTGIDARLTVVGMVSNGFSIADPNDTGMLDVVGFDTAAPQLMADFAAGRL
jgi:60 kDa SS-A/Ro ribonucleoprotein